MIVVYSFFVVVFHVFCLKKRLDWVSGVMEGGFGLKINQQHIKESMSTSRYVSAGQRKTDTERRRGL